MRSVLTSMTAAAAVAAVAATMALGPAAQAGTVPQAETVLWGLASFAPFTTQSLYRVDPATGAATLVGNTGLIQVSGMAFDAPNNRMYAITAAAELHTVDLRTGQTALVGDANRILGEGDLAFVGATLYTIDGLSLSTVNSATGAITPVGPLGAAANDVSGLAWDGSRLLGYSKNGLAQDSIVSINPATGLATLVGLAGINTTPGVGGMSIDPVSGAAFLTDGSILYSLNTFTGSATMIGAHGAAGFSALAIPAPGAAALLGSAGLLAGLRRRR